MPNRGLDRICLSNLTIVCDPLPEPNYFCRKIPLGLKAARLLTAWFKFGFESDSVAIVSLLHVNHHCLTVNDCFNFLFRISSLRFVVVVTVLQHEIKR